ncbi:hypothetical protein CP533_2207 [Ophiocordyceps camponoti-saundersi (nom. inval.)]|nr:hypothetical protein CP533_2207 [Ophiocordyceps camponoti-saundersi (nom. inval.)]
MFVLRARQRIWDTSIPSPHAPLPKDVEVMLMTLHVLFPSIILPALDLLDRKAVSRLSVLGNAIAQDESSPACYRKPHSLVNSAGDRDWVGDIDADVESFASPAVVDHAGGRQPPSARLYVVKSSDTRRRDREPAPVAVYRVVHVDAWSCSFILTTTVRNTAFIIENSNYFRNEEADVDFWRQMCDRITTTR